MNPNDYPRITVRLPADLIAQVRASAEALGCTPSALIRRAIEAFLSSGTE